MIYIITVLC